LKIVKSGGSFEYDHTLVPDVEFVSEWKLEDGFINQIYRAGGWSFETSEEDSVKYAKTAIYAWIAWHDYLVSASNVREDSVA